MYVYIYNCVVIIGINFFFLKRLRGTYQLAGICTSLDNFSPNLTYNVSGSNQGYN